MTGVVERLLLNEKQASEALNLSPRTLFNLRQRGEIPYKRFGKAIRYSLSDLQRWVDANRQIQQGTNDGQ